MATIRVKFAADARDLEATLARVNGGAAATARTVVTDPLRANAGAVTTAGPYKRWYPGILTPEQARMARGFDRLGINGMGLMSQLGASQYGAFGRMLGGFGMSAGNPMAQMAWESRVREGRGMFGKLFGGLRGRIGSQFGLDETTSSELAMAITTNVRNSLKEGFRTATRNIGRGITIGAGLLVGASLMGMQGQAQKYSLARMAEFGDVSSPADITKGIREAESISEQLGIPIGRTGGSTTKDQVVRFMNAMAIKTPATAYSTAGGARTLAIGAGMDFRVAMSAIPALLSASAMRGSTPEEAALGLLTYSQTGQRRSLQAAVGVTPEQLAAAGYRRGSTTTETMRNLLTALNKVALSDPRYKHALESLQEEPQTAFSNLGDAFLRATEPIARILSNSVVPLLETPIELLRGIANSLEGSPAGRVAMGVGLTGLGINALTGGAAGRATGSGLSALGMLTPVTGIVGLVSIVLAAAGLYIANWIEERADKRMAELDKPVTFKELRDDRARKGLPPSDYRFHWMPKATAAELKTTELTGMHARASAEAAYDGVMP